MWNCRAYHLAFGEWLWEKLEEEGVVKRRFAEEVFRLGDIQKSYDKLRSRCKPDARWGLNELCSIANHDLFREHPSYLLAQVELYYKMHRHELEKKLAEAKQKSSDNAPPIAVM